MILIEGLQFKAKGNSRTVFVITDLSPNTIIASWIENDTIVSARYPRKTAHVMFGTGDWKLVRKKYKFYFK